MIKIGLLGFSFSSHDPIDEPGPCNERLRRAVERIVRKIEKGVGIQKITPYTWDWYDLENWEQGPEISLVMAVQREIGCALEESHSSKKISPNLIINQHQTSNTALDPEEVVAQAAEFFRREGVTIVVPVAHRFFRLEESKRLVKQAGFEVLSMPELIGKIGFDPKSKHWSTRGPLRSLYYECFTFKRKDW
ncbi:MAG: hypothetical protein Q8L36_01290 [bacterium]|nr:hypothetical protein [bacterium]